MNSINNRNEFNKDKGTSLGNEEHFHFKEKINNLEVQKQITFMEGKEVEGSKLACFFIRKSQNSALPPPPRHPWLKVIYRLNNCMSYQWFTQQF